MPGALNYNYTKSIHLFNISNVNPASNEIDLTSVGPLDYTVNRTFVNPVYDDAKKIVNYTMKHDYDQINPQLDYQNANITTVNLDG